MDNISAAIMTTLNKTIFVTEMAIGDGQVMGDDGTDMGIVITVVLKDQDNKQTIISLSHERFVSLADMILQHLFDSMTLKGRKNIALKLMEMAVTKITAASSEENG